jgi:hypothetical protein
MNQTEEVEAMAVDFSDKRFRSDFEAEKKRILAAIKDCEAMDKELTTTCGELNQSMNRARGAASLVVRMTEQIISNRNHRLALIKELRALKRDVLEREIKLAEKEDEAGKLINASGVSAALLSHLQAVILAPGGASALLEPAGAAPEEKPQAAASEEASSDEEAQVPTEIRVGDIVSDPGGSLWVITEEGAEPAEAQADVVVTEPDGDEAPYAILADGRLVLVVDIE